MQRTSIVAGIFSRCVRYAHKASNEAKQVKPKLSSKGSSESLKWGITVNSTGEAIVCWHPPSSRAVPYNCTRALPRDIEELRRGESALRIRVSDEAVMQGGGPTDAQLAQLFHTTKHPWFPESRSKKMWPRSKPERDAI